MPDASANKAEGKSETTVIVQIYPVKSRKTSLQAQNTQFWAVTT